MTVSRIASTGLLVSVLLGSLLAGIADAQERPAPVVEVAAGWAGFADDGVVSEGIFGGAARLYLTPRISVGPEILYFSGSNHSHLALTGNVTFDLFSPSGSAARTFTPFLVAGGGLFQTRETNFSEDFTSNEGAFTAGGGIRALAGDRVSVGFDARVGWELHLRLNGFVGIQLGR
jgi:hypothetical protein